MGSELVCEFTDANFEQEVVNSDMPVLVDFWAEWCMPCKMLAPTVEELAEEYSGRLKVGKVDTDASREISLTHGISAIPTLVVFKGGEVVKRLVGMQQKSELKEVIDEVL